MDLDQEAWLEEYGTLDRMMQNRTSQTLTAVSILSSGSLVAFGQLFFSKMRGVGAVGLDIAILSFLVIAFSLYSTTYRLNTTTMERLREIEHSLFLGEGAYNHMWKSINFGHALRHRFRKRLWFAALAVLIFTVAMHVLSLVDLLTFLPSYLQ